MPNLTEYQTIDNNALITYYSGKENTRIPLGRFNDVFSIKHTLTENIHNHTTIDWK